ncbi:UDP-N-acetylmuramoyl-L-alanine--D-glutamate ligase [Thalassotalea euphylliae]|uniref:UDP-N-acetylmuramoylalanine--D-glutamate ligase n=1 Tax=Thalassotalea euphylliae TaxID=1655234 RepID=A0A3E0TVX2_9GAMM|nr:UDP-N-acetylmuramoyl-L-alanine--D-glutamate ligase [Thalassotalea euphylliae]REL28072.1 UDP-N-acetylmuramoyl-L-alanine--D-glutamate ligase [Thalassotalea euphylliae]
MSSISLTQLQDKRIVVLGLGLTGMSFVRFLTNNGLSCAVNDSRAQHPAFAEFADSYPECQLYTGQWHREVIAQADILLASPGVDITLPAIAEHISENAQVWGDVELYARLKDTPCVAVTGSNGKSTVVNLLHHIGQKLGVDTQLGGNVGVPVLDTINESPELLILELSSFQLETISSLTPLVASVLNLSDDHLDRHNTMALYTALKQGIYRGAQFAVFNAQDSATMPLPDFPIAAKNSCSFSQSTPASSALENSDAQQHFGVITHQGETYLAKGEQLLMAVAELPIAGLHNAANCLAALAIGEQLGWELAKMLDAIKSYQGLAHRCQPVASDDGIRWINDSKATNVGATLAALKGLAPSLGADQKLYLIAGGEGKGADFSPLAPVIAEHVAHVFALGKDQQQILALSENSTAVDSIEQAVANCKQRATAGDVVMLSPACASIDMFTNFVERGNAFAAAVTDVARKSSEELS